MKKLLLLPFFWLASCGFLFSQTGEQVKEQWQGQ
jgi:hypothetical protein